jgi:hypothetical protein
MHVNLLTLLVATSSLKLKEPVSQMSARRTNIQSTTFFVLAVFMMGLGSVTGRFADEQGAKMSTSSASKSPKMLNDVPKTCPISKLPLRPFLPPSPYPGKTGSDSFWFGKVKLWTSLPADGTWRGLPHYTPDDPTFRQKLLFWRQGYTLRSELPPQLMVTGRRLDASAPPLQADNANAGWQDKQRPFIVTGVNFPTLGCWEVTGDYHGDRLTFVICVAQ